MTLRTRSASSVPTSPLPGCGRKASTVNGPWAWSGQPVAGPERGTRPSRISRTNAPRARRRMSSDARWPIRWIAARWAARSRAASASAPNGVSDSATQIDPSSSSPARTGAAIRGASGGSLSTSKRTTPSPVRSARAMSASSRRCCQSGGTARPRMTCRRGSSISWPRFENARTRHCGSSIVTGPPTVAATASASANRSPTAMPDAPASPRATRARS